MEISQSFYLSFRIADEIVGQTKEWLVIPNYLWQTADEIDLLTLLKRWSEGFGYLARSGYCF